MNILVTGIFKEPADAVNALEALASAGISRNEINVIASDRAKMESFGIQTKSKAGEGAAIGGTVGATLGAVIAGFTTVGALATGGAGLLIAGPIVAILAGAGAGAAAGGLVGALVGLGIPKHLVEYYSNALEKGSVLIGVKVDRGQADAVREILKNHGAETPTTEPAPGPAPAAAGLPVNGTDCPPGVSMFSEKANTLHALFLEQLKDVYYAEKQLVTALPAMRDKATDRHLAAAFAEHLDETVRHVTRLEEVFSSIGLKPQEHKCPAINGIITEAKELMAMDGTPAERDAALICAAQKAEHYEMATYGCLRAYARTLGLDAAATLLAQTLHEEQAADRKLTELAESGINADAAKHGGGLVGSTRTYRPE